MFKNWFLCGLLTSLLLLLFQIEMCLEFLLKDPVASNLLHSINCVLLLVFFFSSGNTAIIFLSKSSSDANQKALNLINTVL